ncbi:MAG: Arc family DNA-binding protein [Glaciimonas sp.]|nr:Arc family DNA-binding protein [Glaciimonas sp.]
MPSDLRAELKDAGERNGRSMNAEIIARLQAAPITDRLDRIERDISEIKAMLREMLDR